MGDFLEILNGGSPLAPSLWKGCGSMTPPTLRSMSNKLWVRFHTDNQVKMRMKFTKSTNKVTFFCIFQDSIFWSKRILIYCFFIHHRVWGYISWTIRKHLITNGLIVLLIFKTSFSYHDWFYWQGDDGTSKYPNSAECVWDIIGEPGFHVELNFYDRFDIELTEGCINDYIVVNNWRIILQYTYNNFFFPLDHQIQYKP